jgi:hypothetical protein
MRPKSSKAIGVIQRILIASGKFLCGLDLSLCSENVLLQNKLHILYRFTIITTFEY